jgi:hypothetical protein
MQDAPKTTLRERIGTASQTTYQDLQAANNTGISTLLTITPPRIGTYWIGQGGIYAGILRDGDRQWHLILAATQVDTNTIGHKEPAFTPKPYPALTAEWGTYGETIPGEFSRRDGQHNTALILAAEPSNAIALHCSQIQIDGHSDYYWPAQCENNLLLSNLPEHFSPEWHWSSTQYSAHRAWDQDFGDGYQNIRYKCISLAARAVRRILIIQ